MKKILILAVLLTLNIGNIWAQNTEEYFYNKIHIESGEGINKKSCEGYIVQFQLTKKKTTYTAIVVNKAVVNNSANIKLYFYKEKDQKPSNEEPYILTFPIDSDYIIQDSGIDLVIIPFWKINRMLNEKDIKIFYFAIAEDDLSEQKTQIKEDELSKIKKIWEWEVIENIKRNL